MKKDEIKASLTGELFSYLSGKAYQHKMTFQDYVSQLAYEATNNEQLIRSIARWFRRSYALTPCDWYVGHVIAAKYQDLLPEGKSVYRRSLKNSPEQYLRICEVASALACPPATAATILLFAAQLQGLDIVDSVDTNMECIG